MIPLYFLCHPEPLSVSVVSHSLRQTCKPTILMNEWMNDEQASANMLHPTLHVCIYCCCFSAEMIKKIFLKAEERVLETARISKLLSTPPRSLGKQSLLKCIKLAWPHRVGKQKLQGTTDPVRNNKGVNLKSRIERKMLWISNKSNSDQKSFEIFLFICFYLWLYNLHSCTGFSSCSVGYSPAVVHGLLISVVSLIVEHGPWEKQLW